MYVFVGVCRCSEKALCEAVTIPHLFICFCFVCKLYLGHVCACGNGTRVSLSESLFKCILNQNEFLMVVEDTSSCGSGTSCKRICERQNIVIPFVKTKLHIVEVERACLYLNLYSNVF